MPKTKLPETPQVDIEDLILNGDVDVKEYYVVCEDKEGRQFVVSHHRDIYAQIGWLEFQRKNRMNDLRDHLEETL